MDNGGTVILAIMKRGTTDTTYIQASTIAAKTGGYRLTNLTFHNPQTIAGTNDIWNIVASHTDAVFNTDLIGTLAKNQLPTDVVYAEDLQGKETDRYCVILK